MKDSFENYYSGTSGLLLPVPNKLHYPDEFQDKSRLYYYASLMNSIEINSSFYKIPLSSTIKKWADDVPKEFRHQSLYTEEVYELLETYQMGMVIHDKYPSNSPIRESHTDFIYLRFHGPEGNFRGSYEEGVLNDYAIYINQWLSEGKTVFVYFNNTMGEAHANLSMLRQIVSENYQ